MRRTTVCSFLLLILLPPAFEAAAQPQQRRRFGERFRQRLQDKDREGRPAPDFTLQRKDGGEPVTLSSFCNVKPVALVFGSYT